VEDYVLPDTTAVKPRFALVIGSGGGRSVATPGVAGALWLRGNRPDPIVGYRAGAIFSALLAVSHQVQDAVRVATTLRSAELTRRRRWRGLVEMFVSKRLHFNADFCLRDDRAIVAWLIRW
jgi:NTE family protein